MDVNRKCRLCDSYVVPRQDGEPGHVHATEVKCSVIAETLIEADTYKAEPGIPGFDYCTHDAEPDYCDGCLYLRQKHHGELWKRVKMAVNVIDKRRAEYLPDRMEHVLDMVRAILTGQNPHRVTTGISEVDDLLRGGIPAEKLGDFRG